MTLRIVHQLSLLVAGAAVLAMTAVAGVVGWNLRSGFGDYLKARDDRQLDTLLQVVERKAALDPSMNWLRGSRASMEALMDEFALQEGLPAGRGGRPPPPHRAGDRPPPPPPGAPGWGGPRRPPEGGPDDAPAGFSPARRAPPPPVRDGPPPAAADPAPPPGQGITGRVQIFDAQGRWLAGRAQPQGMPVVDRAVKVAGQEVARIRLTREPHLEAIDAGFLRRQYWGLAASAAGTLVVVLVLAAWVARRWSRPLRHLQQATQRMAGGELGVQVEAAGARELAALIGDVNHMSRRLGALDSARRAWIAQMSHELRTPLSVLQGEIEAIQDGARSATPEVLANLHGEVLQLIRLVADLHLLSMADLGQLPCEFADDAAAPLLQRVGQRFSARAAQRGLSLTLEPGPDARVRWDRGRIEQLLTNLLENSLRYTHAPGQICLSWRVQAGTLIITVADSAPGVAPQDLVQVFEPLFRADAARQRSGPEGGSGLGLAIARAIVRAHGGEIRAEASPLGGLTVVVQLPLDH